MDPRTDEILFETYRRGDLTAFRALVERYHDELLRFLIRLMGDRQAAEDAFQETFVQVHLSADSFDTERRFRPWVFTIAANKGRDSLRRKGRRQALDLSAPIGGGSGGGGSSRGGGGSGGGGSDGLTFIDLLEVDIPQPDSAMSEDELSRQVQRTLDEMSAPLREILLLSYFQRLSYSQIAEELNIPLGTVKSRLHSAVASFARLWKSRFDRDGSAANTT
jgi:RNA polymerase sigma-70 factor, ECF subfamily